MKPALEDMTKDELIAHAKILEGRLATQDRELRALRPTCKAAIEETIELTEELFDAYAQLGEARDEVETLKAGLYGQP